MDIKQLCKDAHEIALEKGWYDPPKSFGEMILMCHTELSEAVEDYRGMGLEKYYGEPLPYRDGGNGIPKPCGVPIELADLIIRVADMCEHYGIDIEAAIAEKMEYNKTRPARHGGKAL